MSADIQSKINFLVAKAEKEYNDAKEENKKLNDFIKIQKELINEQRQILSKIAKKSQELLECENERLESFQAITKYNRFLFHLTEDTDEYLQKRQEQNEKEKEESLTENETAFKKIYNGQKAIEDIQIAVFSVTEKCLKEGKDGITKEEFHNLIANVNKIIEKAISSGCAYETVEETIERRARVIETLKE